MNIYQKLVEVRKSVEGFTKDATGYGYKYVSGSQVLSSIKDKMDELGVVLETHLTGAIIGNSNKGYIVSSPVKMIWVNAEKPEDKITVDWFMAGEQKDPSQALGSGLTYSERYFLLKYFGIPTDEDDPDKAKPTNGKNPEPKTEPKPEDEYTILKKELMKKYKGDAVKAKAEFDKIMVLEKDNDLKAVEAELEKELEHERV